MRQIIIPFLVLSIICVATPAMAQEEIAAPHEVHASFESLKGKLPWPVRKGSIVDANSRVPGWVRKNDTSGRAYFMCPKDAPVNAVKDGIVASVYTVEGKKIVTVKHGVYTTVYANLADAVVQQGESVITGQTVGMVQNDEIGQGILDFQIWKAKNAARGHYNMKVVDWLITKQ